ncbi:SDR family oxidoreductase [Microbispora sp. NEAU-D428]|uniref:SDR family oxidoreductase n=1 Tax=Microbispora sitophila TaxID=2771537 RepID=UPI001865CC9B|nr:SDR family oxidoreductase [Microbispora sitophila]MBE3008509.1 SDR family oxidoreductase [Microbispora sitophila]
MAQLGQLVADLRRGGRLHGALYQPVADHAAPPFGPLGHVPWEAFAAKVSGELAGVYHLTRRVLPVMRRRRSGRIVYLSATAAELITGSAAHPIAKAAVNAFALQVAGPVPHGFVSLGTGSAAQHGRSM